MKRVYHKAFELALRHEYYSDWGKSPFKIRPSEASARKLRGLGLVARATKDGLLVLYEATQRGNEAPPIQPLDEKATLHFLVETTFPALMNYVAMPPQSGRDFFVFGNTHDQIDGDDRILLSHPDGSGHASAADRLILLGLAPTLTRETAKDVERVQVIDEAGKTCFDRNLLPNDKIITIALHDLKREGRYTLKRDGLPDEILYIHAEAVTRSACAMIEVRLGDEVAANARIANAQGRPLGKTLAVFFAKPQTQWRYIVIPRGENKLPADKIQIEGGAPVPFSAAPVSSSGTIEINGETAYIFESDGLMPLQHKRIQSIQMKTAPHENNFKTLIANLPNPSPETPEYQKDLGLFYSNIYVYV